VRTAIATAEAAWTTVLTMIQVSEAADVSIGKD